MAIDTIDYMKFLDMSPSDIYSNWLDWVASQDPLLQDRSPNTFNSHLAELIAAESYILVQLLKKKVIDSNILTASGSALTALSIAMLPQGRYPGEKATGSIKFSRSAISSSDLLIPIGTICAMTPESGGAPILFQTTENATIAAGELSVFVTAQAIIKGIASNVGVGTIDHLRSSVLYISSITNDAPFTGGTDSESDDALRLRALNTIWEEGKATVPLMQNHISGVQGVREVKVYTIGEGDVLIVVDSAGGIVSPEPAIGDMIYNNLAGGNTSPGVLGASLRGDSGDFSLNISSGGKVLVRTLQYISEPTTIDFVYKNLNGSQKNGTITFPIGTALGATCEATLDSPTSMSTEIISSSYDGDLNFDLFMALGTYPDCWVTPKLMLTDIALKVVLTDTPEANLIANIQASLTAALSSFKIGDTLRYSALIDSIYTDFTTRRTFQGIKDINLFEIICGETILTSFGEYVVVGQDERITPGNLIVQNVELDAIVIDDPASGIEVDWQYLVKGTSIAVEGSNLNVYTLVWPENSNGPWWISDVTLDQEGNWEGIAYFGRDPQEYPHPADDGVYRLVAVMTTDILWPNGSVNNLDPTWYISNQCIINRVAP